MGEAPARSSLVPRDLTAELCLIALASFGLSGYSLRRIFVCSFIFTLLASLGILLLRIRLTAFFIGRC